VLSEELQATVKIHGEAVLRGFLFLRAFVGMQGIEGLLLRLELRIASRPRQELAVLGEDRVENLSTKGPAPLVGTAILRQDADPPFLHHRGRETTVPAHVARCRGRHVGHVPQEFLVERHEFACLLVLTLSERDIACGHCLRFRSFGDGRDRPGRRSRGVAQENASHSLKFFALEFVTNGPRAREPTVHQREEVAAHLALIGVTGEDLLRIPRIDREFTLAGVIAGAVEKAVQPDLSAGALCFEDDVAFRSRLRERRLGLSVIDALILLVHAKVGRKRGPGYTTFRSMSTCVSLSPRDLSLLRLLSWTPATTALLLRASSAFDGGPFIDERRLRERLQSLTEAGAVRYWPMAQGGGGLQNYYKLTPLGFDMTCGVEALRPSRAFFAEVSPSLVVHTFRLAEVIVETLRACSARRVTIDRFIRENEIAFTAGDRQVQPDCFFRLAASERLFNLAFEIDNSMASVDAHATNSIREKLTTYERYQELLLSQWLASGKKWERPRFRVVFLTQSISRAYHILALAAEIARTPSRRLVYAAPLDSFVTDPDPLFAPLFLDHAGSWQSLINLHPSAPCLKAPVRLAKPLESPLAVC
jgi:hypothetical protein